MSNGGISIFINSTTSFPNETISFELFHNGNRTGKIKSVPLQSGQYVSWGDFPAGNYEIRITSSKADYYNNVYLFENEKLSYNLILFNDNFLLLININDQTYDKLEKVSNTQVFL